MSLPSPVFLGYRAKQSHRRMGAWEMQNFPAIVLEVCSVSDCMSKPPPGWVDRWDFNRAFCYRSPATARAVVPAEETGEYDIFSYWLLPFTVVDGQRRDVSLDDLFDVRLPALPDASQAPTDFENLGFDVFERSPPARMGFGHSPLSCSGLAKEVPVNSYCLVETEADAISLVERCNREQPEPGVYYAVHVKRQRR